MKKYKINEVAWRLGLSTGAIRYYEEKGLLSVEKDKENGYRLFTEEDIYKLWSVAYHRDYRMSLKEIDELKHGATLKDVELVVEKQREETEAEMSRLRRKQKMLELYDAYILRATHEEEAPRLEKSERFYFYPDTDLFSRSGASYPACTFGSYFDGKSEEAYSVVYESDMDFLPKDAAGKANFTVSPFDGIHVIISLECFLDAAAALAVAREKATVAGYEVTYPCCVLYLLSTGSFENARRYYDVWLTPKQTEKSAK